MQRCECVSHAIYSDCHAKSGVTVKLCSTCYELMKLFIAI